MSNPNDGSLHFLNMSFSCFFFTSPFDCGYSGNDVLLKSHAATNSMCSANAEHGPVSEYTS